MEMMRAEYVQPFGPLRPPFPFALPPTKPYDPALVGDWRFYENTGTTAHDLSRERNHGTITGATWESVGRHGPALDFDGAADFVSLVATNQLFNVQKATIEAWIMPETGTATVNIILSNYNGGALVNGDLFFGWNDFVDAFNFLNGITLFVGTGAGAGYQRSYNAGIASLTWGHVEVVIDTTQAVAADRVRLWGDGVELTGADVINFDAGVGGGESIGNNATVMRIGSNIPPQPGFFKNLIDEVSILQRARSAAEAIRRYEVLAG